MPLCKHIRTKKKRGKIIKKISIISFMIIFFLSFFPAGCDGHRHWRVHDYESDYPELFTVAIHSLLETRGNSEFGLESIIKIIDVDEYGRILFYYEEASNTNALLISQKSDEEYVYFYSDLNFITNRPPYFYTSLGEIDLTAESNFSDESIEKLKVFNDWNCAEIDSNRLTQAEIVRDKPTGPVDDATLMEFYRLAFSGFPNDQQLARRAWAEYLTSDIYGRSIYWGYGDVDQAAFRRLAVLLFNPDGSYDADTGSMIITVEDYDYQERLLELKTLNNWNQPWEE